MTSLSMTTSGTSTFGGYTVTASNTGSEDSSKNMIFILEHTDFDGTLDVSMDITDLSNTLSADAVADIYVPLDVMRAAFKFQTDASDLTNADSVDVLYQQNLTTFDSAVDLSLARVTNATTVGAYFESGGSKTFGSEQRIGDDYTRYMAYKFFGSHLGTDFITNEAELKTNVHDKLTGSFTTYCSTNNSTSLTNSTTDNSNLTRQLLGQLALFNPERLRVPNSDSGKPLGSTAADISVTGTGEMAAATATDFTTNPSIQMDSKYYPADADGNTTIFSTEEFQPIPFKIGDVVVMKYTQNPGDNHGEGLESAFRTAGNTRLDARSYLIRMIVSKAGDAGSIESSDLSTPSLN